MNRIEKFNIISDVFYCRKELKNNYDSSVYCANNIITIYDGGTVIGIINNNLKVHWNSFIGFNIMYDNGFTITCYSESRDSKYELYNDFTYEDYFNLLINYSHITQLYDYDTIRYFIDNKLPGSVICL